MSAITIPNLPAKPAILPRQYIVVQIKRKWSDAWKTVPHITFAGGHNAVGPDVDQFQLIWHWGDVLWEDASAFAVTDPQDITNWLVRVAPQVPSAGLSGAPTSLPILHGVIAPSSHMIMGDGTTATGADQTITCFGFAHLLDRVAIDQAWAMPVGGTVPVAIADMPMINTKEGGGYTASVGNRSTAKVDGPYGEAMGQSYVYAQDGEVWTLRDYVEYLLVNFPPGGPDHGDIVATLAGQVDALDAIVLPEMPASWASLKDALDDLISARRGLGYALRVTDTTDPDTGDVTGTCLSVHVYSTASKLINVAGTIIPANAERSTFNPGNLDEGESVTIDLDPTADYDRLIVRGNRVLTCMTLSVADATLVKGWTDIDEADYLDADAKGRAGDSLRHVWRLYMVNPDWAWKVGNGIGYDITRKANPGCTKDGVVTPDMPGTVRNWGLSFERFIPFARAASELIQPELSEPMVWLCDADNVYYQADVPPDDADLPGCSIRPVGTGLAFELATNPAHLLALNHEGDADFDEAPKVDYETMIATMAVRTDTRLQVTQQLRQSLTSTRPGRTRTIDVPGAEAWYVVPGTVIGLSDSDVSPFVRHPGGLVRDDGLMLRSIATIARAWYATPRAVATITIDGINTDYRVGMMLDAVVAGLNTQSVNTVVTRISYDLTSGDSGVDRYQTVIQTGYADMDFASMDARRSGGMMDIVQRLMDQVMATLPVRTPNIMAMRPPGRYRVKTVNTDHLICRTWDGTNEGNKDILIALPENCRSDRFPGFSFASNVVVVDGQTVKASGTVGDKSVTEVWRITPPYIENETTIFAKPCRRGSGTTNCSMIEDSSSRQWVMTYENPNDL